MLQDAFDDLGNGWTDFNIIIEQFWFGVVAGLAIVEDMWEEDDFELVEVEGLGDVQQQVVGVVSGVGLSHFMQDLVGFVGQATTDVLPLELLVPAATGTEPLAALPTDRTMDLQFLHIVCSYNYILSHAHTVIGWG